jgi:Lysine-specific metallo-endopeptidase
MVAPVSAYRLPPTMQSSVATQAKPILRPIKTSGNLAAQSAAVPPRSPSSKRAANRPAIPDLVLLSATGIGRLAARDTEVHSSRSLTAAEKKTVTQATKDAKGLLVRTRYALTDGWNSRVPNSKLTQRQVFKQYFGGDSQKLRKEVLTRVVRVEKLVDRTLSSDIGNSVVRATGKNSTGFAYVAQNGNIRNQTIYLGDDFFKASDRPNDRDSKAGTIVHELFHFAAYNGQRGTDDVPGKGDTYDQQSLRNHANTSPDKAVQNNNLFQWYVERDK